MKNFLAVGICALMLSSCSILPQPGEPIKKYTLQSVKPGDFPSSGILRPRQLIVGLPLLYPPLDNARIALKPQEQTIDYYADVEWADRLSPLLQESLIYSLQNAGKLRGVSRSAEGIQADYTLKIEVRKFYVDQSDKIHPQVAQVEYLAHIIKLPERHIVASRQFGHAQTIPENTMDMIIKSLNTAHLEATKALVPWVLEHVR